MKNPVYNPKACVASGCQVLTSGNGCCDHLRYNCRKIASAVTVF